VRVLLRRLRGGRGCHRGRSLGAAFVLRRWVLLRWSLRGRTALRLAALAQRPGAAALAERPGCEPAASEPPAALARRPGCEPAASEPRTLSEERSDETKRGGCGGVPSPPPVARREEMSPGEEPGCSIRPPLVGSPPPVAAGEGASSRCARSASEPRTLSEERSDETKRGGCGGVPRPPVVARREGMSPGEERGRSIRPPVVDSPPLVSAWEGGASSRYARSASGVPLRSLSVRGAGALARRPGCEPAASEPRTLSEERSDETKRGGLRGAASSGDCTVGGDVTGGGAWAQHPSSGGGFSSAGRCGGGRRFVSLRSLTVRVPVRSLGGRGVSPQHLSPGR
jgi:hypothetical protein